MGEDRVLTVPELFLRLDTKCIIKVSCVFGSVPDEIVTELVGCTVEEEAATAEEVSACCCCCWARCAAFCCVFSST